MKTAFTNTTLLAFIIFNILACGADEPIDEMSELAKVESILDSVADSKSDMDEDQAFDDDFEDINMLEIENLHNVANDTSSVVEY